MSCSPSLTSTEINISVGSVVYFYWSNMKTFSGRRQNFCKLPHVVLKFLTQMKEKPKLSKRRFTVSESKE